MTTAPTLDELEQSIIDFVIGLCFGEDNKIHGEKAIRDALTSYGTARYDDGVEEERERCKRCYEANTRHNPHSLSEPYSPNYKNANTATTHISYLDTDFVPKPRFTTDKTPQERIDEEK